MIKKTGNNEIKSTSHSKYRCQYHIVFAPKYCRKINVSPSRLADNRFIVPTDPGKLILDDGDNGTKKWYLLLEITACQANKYLNQ
ncbi:MAG: hypothetical protein ACI4FN_01885 [Acutalibacteraceae bacterium]